MYTYISDVKALRIPAGALNCKPDPRGTQGSGSAHRKSDGAEGGSWASSGRLA